MSKVLNIVFYLPIAVFIYSLFRVIEERKNRGSRAFNIYALLMVASFVLNPLFWGHSIGKFLAMFGVVLSVFFLMIARRYYKLGFAICSLVSLYLLYW